MRKYLIILFFLFVCLFSAVTQDITSKKNDYTKITKTLTTVYKTTDKFISEINKAKNANQIIKALNKITTNLEKIKNDIIQVNNEHSYLFSNEELPEDIPDNLKNIINKIKILGESEDFSTAFNKLAEWKDKDEKVNEAYKKFENIMKE